MQQQNINSVNFQQKNKELMKIIDEKDQLQGQLFQRIGRQQKQMMSIMQQFDNGQAHRIPFNVYNHFIKVDSSSNDQVLICFKVNKESFDQKLPIWLSKNLEITTFKERQMSKNNKEVEMTQSELKEVQQIGIQVKTIEDEDCYQYVLTHDVSQLKDNLEKYQSIIMNLKEMKELEKVQKQQLQMIGDRPNRQQKLKNYITSLQKIIFQNKQLLKNTQKQKQELLERIVKLQQNLKQYVIKIQKMKQPLQNESLNKSDLHLHKKMKRYLINF